MPRSTTPNGSRGAGGASGAPLPRSLPLLLLIAAPATCAVAQGTRHETHAEFLLGTAWSLPAPLVIRLPGQAPVRVRARYETRPWRDAPYYAYRAGGGSAAGCSGPPAGYEGELLHHKLYLPAPPPPIEHFEVTHGYNLTSATLVRPAHRLAVRIGVGLVVAHAEGRVAGEKVGGTRRTFLGRGYHLAGITAMLAVARRYPLARGRTALYAAPEAKLTASFARVPVGDAGGRAVVPNVAVHALAGLGVCRTSR